MAPSVCIQSCRGALLSRPSLSHEFRLTIPSPGLGLLEGRGQFFVTQSSNQQMFIVHQGHTEVNKTEVVRPQGELIV